MENDKMPYSSEIGILINAIMQSAIAGGMTEKRAAEIYDEIMSCIVNCSKNSEGENAFKELLGEILNKWYPMASKVAFH